MRDKSPTWRSAKVAVVGASFPSFGSYIFAVTCFLVAICQPVGWIGVLRVRGCPPSSAFKRTPFVRSVCSTNIISNRTGEDGYIQGVRMGQRPSRHSRVQRRGRLDHRVCYETQHGCIRLRGAFLSL